jgi:hypothetical protein|tara:strand:+ start:1089 stop:1280 length:192 start_codon:yes stop_codon:yes gene_type:complete
MDNTKNNKDKDKELQDKLNNFLNDKESCEGEECLIKDNDELVQREHKKIITSDGRQLLSEYTR